MVVIASRPDLPAMLARRRPGFTLERDFYVHPDVFELDVREVFFRNWLYVGHESQIPAPGDYLTYELAGESIIVARGDDGALHGSFNVCRHRGARMLYEPCGHAKAIVCPYHRWVYGLDGSLRGAPTMNEQVADKTSLGLRSVRVESWNGLLYIHLGDDPPPDETMAQRLAPAAEVMKGHRLRHTKIIRSVDYDLPANWKLFMENYRECYHCRGAHPEFSATIPVDQLDENRGTCSTRLIKTTGATFTRYALKPGAVSQSLDGEPVSIPLGTLTRDETLLHALCMYPAHAFMFGNDYGIAFSVRPIAPLQTRFTAHWYVNADAVEGRDYDVAKVTALWDVTNQQDKWLTTINQQGVCSRAYVPGPYSAGQEDDVEHFVTWYLSHLNAGTGA